jgi:hypothetical protein
LRGGGGDDLLSDDDNDGAADADVLDGGAGTFDTVSYDNRRDGVAVDLEAAGEDTLSGFEVVVGGAGDDRLAGGEQTDRLVGGAGDDVLEGRGGGSSVDDEEDEQLGNEELVGGAGDDQLDGGDGADTLDGGAGRDRFTCGAGRDIVLAPETGEFLTAACESLRVQGTPPRGSFGVMVFPPVPHAVAGGTVRHFLACPRVEALDDAVVRCRGKLTLREAGGRRRLLGRAPFADRRHRPRFRVDVALTRLGRRLARAGVDVTATARGPRVPTAAWSYRLEV